MTDSNKKDKKTKKSIEKETTPRAAFTIQVPDFSPILELDKNLLKSIRHMQPMYMNSLASPLSLLKSESSLFIDNSTQKLEGEITDLKKERADILKKLTHSDQKGKEDKAGLEKLMLVSKELNKKLSFGNLLFQVNQKAGEKLFNSNEFLSLFEKTKNCESFVISIDIRRSTELMLKARTPELFEGFIVSLCDRLAQIILNNYGVFDKFTGDGILAFFPNFYSGTEAGLRAVKTAIECHSFFKDHYKKNKHCFISVLKDIGLGIGIDYGDTYIVKIRGTYTVIGPSVVYACRMSGAKAGDTLLNQPAYEEIFENYKHYFNIFETDINFKNEGSTVAYKVISNGESIQIDDPDWDNLIEKYLPN